MLTTTYCVPQKSAEDSDPAILCAYLSATIFDPVLDVKMSLSLSRSLTLAPARLLSH